MRKIDYLRDLLVAVSVLFMFPNPAVSAGRIPVGLEPPYVAGEVAVYATPDELGESTILKVLPNAGITVLAVERGTEKNDATVYPGAPDSRRRYDRNGVDNDCDGLVDR